MPKKESVKVTELELGLLQHIWERGNQATVSEILEGWAKEKPGYTTVLKTLQKMEEKGIVKHRQEGKSYLYYSLYSREQVSEGRLGAIVGKIFSGNKLSFAEYFIKSSDLSLDDIAELKKLIQERERHLKR